MADGDANKEALDQVERVTGSEPIKGDNLLESSELKRQLREAKERLKSVEANLRAVDREDQKS